MLFVQQRKGCVTVMITLRPIGKYKTNVLYVEFYCEIITNSRVNPCVPIMYIYRYLNVLFILREHIEYDFVEFSFSEKAFGIT